MGREGTVSRVSMDEEGWTCAWKHRGRIRVREMVVRSSARATPTVVYVTSVDWRLQVPIDGSIRPTSPSPEPPSSPPRENDSPPSFGFAPPLSPRSSYPRPPSPYPPVLPTRDRDPPPRTHVHRYGPWEALNRSLVRAAKHVPRRRNLACTSRHERKPSSERTPCSASERTWRPRG